MISISSTSNFIADLLPQVRDWKNYTIWDSFKKDPNSASAFIQNLMDKKSALDMAFLRFNGTVSGQAAGQDLDYNKYLQYPNTTLFKLAKEITKGFTTDTEKMYAVEQWVNANITYQTDDINYGVAEHWAYPTETLNRKRADCEDYSFLITSLAIHAGVDTSRVRMYGGLVKSGTGAMSKSSVAGHGWGAFKRDDGEWVPIEGSYYATDLAIDDRVPLKDNYNYVEDFWYVTKDGVVDATWRNYIRHPELGATMSKEHYKGWSINIQV